MKKITQDQLVRMVSESVSRIITESNSTCSEIRQALNTLKGVTESGFIPFSSPSPSSTELTVRKNIEHAISSLEMALEACRELGYCDSIEEGKTFHCGNTKNFGDRKRFKDEEENGDFTKRPKSFGKKPKSNSSWYDED